MLEDTIFRVLQNVGIMDFNTNLDLRNNILICGIYLYRSSSNLTTYSGYSNNNMVFGGYEKSLRFITVAGLPTSGISLRFI